MYYSEEIGLPKTDISRWRLRSDALGRETWHYLSQSECEVKVNHNQHLSNGF